MVEVALMSYILAPAREPKLTIHDEVQEAIRGLKVNKAPGSKSIPNRALKYLPKRKVSLLAQILNAVLRTITFPSVQARSSDLCH